MFKYLKKINFLLEKNFIKIWFLIFLTILVSAIDILVISLTAIFIDLLINSEPTLKGRFFNTIYNTIIIDKDLQLFFYILLILYLIKFIFSFLLLLFSNYVVFNNQLATRNKIINLKNKLSIKNFEKENTKNLLNKIVNLASIFSVNVVNSYLKLMSSFVILVSLIIFMGYTDLKLAIWLGLFVGIALFFFNLFFSKIIREYGKQESEAVSGLMGSINIYLNSFAELKALNKSYYFSNYIFKYGQNHSKILFKTNSISELPRLLIEIIIYISAISLLFYANFLSETVVSVIPKLTVFGFCLLRLLPILSQIIRSLTELSYGKHATDVIYKEFSGKINNKNIYQKFRFEKKENFIFKELKLKKINFSYSNKVILKNISLNIEERKFYIIYGHSGSGKSTLLKIMCGLLQPDKGSILINSNKASINNLNRYKKNISFIKQESFILNDTLKENVTLDKFDNRFNEKKFLEVFNILNLSQIIDNKNISELNLGENGKNLSGGQRQRVSIARSLYHDKKIIFLDEPTNALDRESEKKIMNELKKLSSIKTIILVTHNKKNFVFADKIYYMNKGRVSKNEIK